MVVGASPREKSHWSASNLAGNNLAVNYRALFSAQSKVKVEIGVESADAALEMPGTRASWRCNNFDANVAPRREYGTQGTAALTVRPTCRVAVFREMDEQYFRSRWHMPFYRRRDTRDTSHRELRHGVLDHWLRDGRFRGSVLLPWLFLNRWILFARDAPRNKINEASPQKVFLTRVTREERVVSLPESRPK